MEKKDIRVLALDLDGTLTNDQKVVTPVTRAALDAAAAKGVTIVLASGRPTAGIMPLAKELGLDKRAAASSRITAVPSSTVPPARRSTASSWMQSMCRSSVPSPGSRAWSSLPIISRASSPKAPRTSGR